MAESQAIYQMRITPGMEYIRGPEGSRATQEVLATEKDRSHRVQINIVGKERQGKTSLRKMLSGEPFDAHERSTVGIDQELVETVGIQPKSSWSKVDLQQANEEEFDIILGTHILRRLKTKFRKWSLNKAIAPVVCFMKMAVVMYISLVVYLYAKSHEALDGYPWFAVVVTGIFLGNGLAFGTREGFGIAIGIFHQLLLCESLLRWRVEDWLKDLKTETGFTCAIFSGFLFYGMIESLVAISFGMSLGVGIALIFCLAQPPESQERLDVTCLLSPYVHFFILGCYIGVGSLRYRNFLFYVVAPLLSLALKKLHNECGFLLMCGIGCGHFHAIFLAIGQNSYYLLNMNIEKIVTDRMCKRYIRHCVGFVPGVVLLHIFGWNLENVSWMHILASLFLPITIELVNKFTSNPGVRCGRSASKVLTARVKTASLKLVFRDFAGHPLYYSANHLYMTGQCVYILVFNLLEANENFEATFARLREWLYSIHVHSTNLDVRVFLVGTHRDDPSLSKSVITNIGKKIKEALPRQLHGMVVWNDDDKPLFPVENSVRSDVDPDHVKLRNCIMKEVKSLHLERYPVKYFYFFSLIGTYRKKRVLIKKYEELFKICQTNECRIRTCEEFDELLTFFAQTGEIIHNTRDNILREFIIFDPQAVINILSQLITVPKMSDRDRDIIQDWNLLEEHGICSETLFKKHMVVFFSSENFDEFEKTVYVLERFNLICKIQTGPTQQLTDRFYLIPALLPKDLPFPDNYWKDEPNDHLFIVQTYPALPLTAFLKLAAHCAAYDNNIFANDDSIVLNASQRKALFTYGNTFIYKLEMHSNTVDITEANKETKETGSHDTEHTLCKEQFLRIVIRCQEGSDHLEVLDFLWTALTRIVKRDFPKCRLKLGVCCPCEPPHQDDPFQSGLHILPLHGHVDDTKDFDNSMPGLSKDFWCRGRLVTIRNGKVPRELPDTRTTGQTLLSDLPCTVIRRVCDCLNIPSVLGRDWTELAGRLGKTAREVELLRFRCPGDPCNALLQDLMTTRPDTTVADLTSYLNDMERMDAISELGITQI